jgi:hypothetical protein
MKSNGFFKLKKEHEKLLFNYDFSPQCVKMSGFLILKTFTKSKQIDVNKFK